MLFRKKRKNGNVKLENRIDRAGKLCAYKRMVTERRECSLEKEKNLLPPNGRCGMGRIGKASFCASFQRICKASLAVETALVLPLFFLGMVTLISFMDIYRIQTEHLTALCEKTKKAGMYAFATEQKEITLPDVYSYEPVGGLISLPNVWMYNTVKVHAWTGETYMAGPQENQKESESMVYVTENGSVYHKKASCTYLKLSITTVSGNRVSSMRNTYGEKYAACETCSKNQNPSGNVYLTQTGNRYHNLASCSGLKRTVRLVKHSHAEGMAACSRCG